MSERKVCKLRDISIMRNGQKRPKGSGEYPVYGGNGIMEFSNSYNAENIIVVGRVGAYCGNVHRCKGKCWISDNAISLSANNFVDTDYLYYSLCSLNLNHQHIGGAQPLITQDIIGRFEISLPSLEEQRSIVDILIAIDRKIEVNKRINDNLEQQAQALYKSWFVDFEPFKDSDFVESELGLIPDGWRCGLLSELLAIKYGKDHKKLSDGDIPVYGSGGIMRYVDTKLYEGEAVLIPRKGSLNNVMYVNEPFWTVDTMFYSTAKESNSGIYSYLFLTNKDLASMNAGSAVPSMTTDILNNLQLIIPPKEVLKSFNTLCFILFKRMKQNIIENMNLGNQRDSLLPKLMSGELKINDLDC